VEDLSGGGGGAYAWKGEYVSKPPVRCRVEEILKEEAYCKQRRQMGRGWGGAFTRAGAVVADAQE